MIAICTLAELISRYGGEASLENVLLAEARREKLFDEEFGSQPRLKKTLVGIIRGSKPHRSEA